VRPSTDGLLDESMMEIGPSDASGTGEIGASATFNGFLSRDFLRRSNWIWNIRFRRRIFEDNRFLLALLNLSLKIGIVVIIKSTSSSGLASTVGGH
jgi:hypothetical protein